MTIFDRYLLGRFTWVFVVLFVTTFGLFVVIDGFTNVDAFQEESDGTIARNQRIHRCWRMLVSC